VDKPTYRQHFTSYKEFMNKLSTTPVNSLNNSKSDNINVARCTLLMT